MSGVHIALAKAKKRIAELEEEVTTLVLRWHLLEEELSALGKQTHIYMGIVERLANDFPDVWDEVSE